MVNLRTKHLIWSSQPAYFHIPKIILYFMIFYTELKSNYCHTQFISLYFILA
uniref:Uncharacterized protein n=1 Tax=Anguilla anguilla TaxID=7936 RepID=A0A0E9VXE9_ANGAN